ncbi:ATPase, T2SS/T4P/T4SS family [Aminicella lysinilytica]|uniref:Pilus assembly protein CpaF n=1 Tax=Aminicella lysinilytica TaxID=433323 RepID=A0A4R6QAG3_9FIRM|nr:ATPase, T2SS/T4P/T4SS family [Aminicella lysinilytica]TDP59634.1 pilus assembly protein CpaF [Aminicella lysinilytica]
MDKEFDLEEYMNQAAPGVKERKEGMEGFMTVCDLVGRQFDSEWEETDDRSKNLKLEREKRAIIGYEKDVGYYKERIREILREKKLAESWYPSWYSDLTEAIFAELYGLSGLAPWAYDMCEKYRTSSSAKLIGDRMYCLIDGKSQLQPQVINEKRRQQLKRTLLLATPRERLEYGFHEVYLHNGIRITIYSGDRTKENQDVMVFRKYVLKELSFEQMADLGTIPVGAVELFKTMVAIGFNVIFAGQVRSGKTTFMQTWQKYEDPEMEGLAIATDPETPWHEIMPGAPIMQLIADGRQLESLTKSLLRGDNDYILLEEMRDGTAFKLALDITSTGTTRSKATIHDNDAVNIPYKMAAKIRETYGGHEKELIAQVYKNFDYVLEFSQHPFDKSRKIMKGITEFSYDPAEDRIRATYICKYDFEKGTWQWNDHISRDKERKAALYRDDLGNMRKLLGSLARDAPMEGESSISPAYYRGGGGSW